MEIIPFIHLNILAFIGKWFSSRLKLFVRIYCLHGIMCPGNTTPEQTEKRTICLHPSIRIPFACKVRNHPKVIESSYAGPLPNVLQFYMSIIRKIELHWKRARRDGVGHQYVNFYYHVYLELT